MNCGKHSMNKLFLYATVFCAAIAVRAGETAKLPAEALKPERHPLLLGDRAGLEKIRRNPDALPHLKAYIAEQRKIVAPLPAMSDDELRKLIPPPGAPVVYGLGMNLDPHGERLRWTSWRTPFKVLGKDDAIYPNEAWPDDGAGCEKDGKKYYFTARAHGFIFAELEERALPALADLYALTGEARYAHTAAVLLDAVATVYPANRRGPLDYPGSKKDFDRSGRLQRAYYMVARGLENYATTVDLIAASGELERPSGNPAMATIRENVGINLLRDGGEFCRDWAVQGGQLNNGLADYVRGAAYAGLLLRDPRLLQPLLAGPASLETMIDNNVDRNGFYFETSTTYSVHTNELYCSMAEIVEAARRQGLAQTASFYRHPGLITMSDRFFIRRELSGHMPTIGDDGPDRFWNPPMQRLPDPARPTLSDRYLSSQLRNAWRFALHGAPAVRAESIRLLRALYGNHPIVPPIDRLTLFRITPELIAEVAATPVDDAPLTAGSAFYGGKGLALLRGGRGDLRYGAQLAAGPQNNHGQQEALTWTFFSRGHDWSNDPGYFNSHYRHSWTSVAVAHQSLVANGKSFDPCEGGGYLAGFLADDLVQYAVGVHPRAYRTEGVTRYERIIAQRPAATGDDLGYWLDIGIVAGGEFRDDSFHTAMKELTATPELTPTGAYAMFPGLSEKNQFRRDYRLTGFEDRHFRYEVPGHGYALLTRPRSVRTGGNVRIELANPEFIRESPFKGRIAVDFPGEPEREYVAAVHPGVEISAPVAYLIRRDRGKDGGSVFAKVIRVVDAGTPDPVAAVENLPVQSDDAFARAFRVVRSDGGCDLWLIGALRLAAAGNRPAITSDARLALLVFDPAGRLLHVRATGAKTLEAGDFRWNGPAEQKAKILALDGCAMKLDREFPAGAARPGALLLTVPAAGTPANFTLAKLDGRQLAIADHGVLLARNVPVQSDPDDRRRFTAAFPISRFTAPGSKNAAAAALGKTVLVDGKAAGRIAAMDPAGRAFTLDTPLPAGATVIDIAEAGPGDKLVIPVNLTFDAAPPPAK
jgi:hypothetical protein